ncbi:hypothetical protein [Treponema ruminis]|uniref:Uncharacterized protein n=1 Tax=Treponema ruminis TaxID=744515 RepID=A0A7W8LN59_9SPIR|nr:hypothetical protein [Treponema ruminis]MBB5227266.1 hypothetical protein [Treponema ruminis]
MAIIKKYQKLMAVFVCAFCTFSALAQSTDDVGAVYKKIDMAIASKSADSIAKILNENKSSADYPLIENYTLKKTRQLIITDNLELARQTSLAVIDNNIENFDAVELYSYIDKAILNQQAANQAAENRKRLEEERIAARNAKSKQKLENRGNYQVVSTASGQEVYVNEQQASFSSLLWTVKIGLADFIYQKTADPDYSSLKYGLAIGANVFKPSERLILGCDFFADAHIVTLMSSGGNPEAKAAAQKTQIDSDNPQEFFMSARIVPEIAFADLSKNLFLRAGLAAHLLASNDKAITGSTSTFFSPVLGVALDNLHLGEAQLRAFCDYDAGSLFYNDINMAMEFGGSILLPMAVNDKTKFGLELGVQDLLLMRNAAEDGSHGGGMENRVKFTFAIGVGNVTK